MMFTVLVGMLLSTPRRSCRWRGAACSARWASRWSPAAAAALNHLVDQRIDALMARTRGRPLPRGALRSAQVAACSPRRSASPGMALLLVFTNAAVRGADASRRWSATPCVYSLYLKHATPHNIVIGGAAGAAPPLLGWVAVSGQVDPGALLLFLIILVWTPPHFWALAIHRRDDYARAAIPMLPVTHGVAFTCAAHPAVHRAAGGW